MAEAAHVDLIGPIGMPNFVSRYWRGEGPLWKIFWLYGAIPACLGAGLLAWCLSSGRIGRPGLAALIVVLQIYTAWTLVSIWRCADNAKSERYAVMARAMSVAWGLNAALLSLFLLLALL